MEITTEIKNLDAAQQVEVSEPAPTTVTEREELNDDFEVQDAENQRVIGRIKSSAYGGFTKILATLSANMAKTDIISIENGKLSSISGGGFLYSDMSALFGENNFDIIDPKFNIKMLRLVTGGDEVVFVQDNTQHRYLISSLVDGVPKDTVALPQPDQTTAPRITRPNLGEKVYGFEVHPEVVSVIQTAEKNAESQFFILDVIKDESNEYKINSISTDKETFKHSFNSFDGECTQYKVFNPFPIAKIEELSFELWKNDSDEFWIKTISIVGMASIEYSEKISPMGDFDTFSL